MNQDVMKTGTTTVGIMFKDGVILGADRRASAGYMVADKRAQKVIKINDDMALTIAGLVSDAQLLSKIIRAQLKLIEVRKGKKSSVKQAANLLANLVYNNVRRMSMVPSIVGFLLAGKDDKGFHLYNIGIDGSLSEMEDYVCDGSGMMFATGVLEANYKKNMSLDEAVKLAVQTLNTSMQRDIATGNGIDILAITKEGVDFVLRKELDARIHLDKEKSN
ncbi:proteasome subunit beta [Candidatus Woesearchaeota archaeon]|nr:proteasome subunit beta [Candidatus Woesearchaeota archaeon]